MKKIDKEKVAEILSEKSHFIRVGLLPIKIKPLTLAQIYDMGTAANNVKSDDLQKEDKVNIFAVLMRHAKDAKAMQDVFVVCAFRKRWKRWLLGRYLRNRLTVEDFNRLLSIIAVTFNANFFLTSIIFLSQTKIITEPSETTALGQS